MAIRFDQLPAAAQRQFAGQILEKELKQKSKYGNQKAVRMLASGKELKFDSQKEARRFDELLMMQQAGRIRDLKLQPEFTLQEGYTDPRGWRIRPTRYKADFSYWELTETCAGQQWQYVVEDVKSNATKTRVYEIKKKLLAERKNILVREI